MRFGKDSSVTAALCAEALGKERAVGVMLPDGKQTDICDSYSLLDLLELSKIEVNIKQITTAFSRVLESVSSIKDISGQSELSEQAKINFPPRIRMTVLYAVAQTLRGGGMVANTCCAGTTPQKQEEALEVMESCQIQITRF